MKRFKNILLYVVTKKNAATMNRACELALENGATSTEMDTAQQKLLRLDHSVAQHENAKLHLVSVWDVWREKPLRQQLRSAEEAARRFRRGLN